MIFFDKSRWTRKFVRILKNHELFPGKSPLTLYLHIGLPKTGTTAIQHFLHQNRETLIQEQNVLYPECGIPVFQHAALVKSIVQPLFPWAHFSEMIETVNPGNYLREIVDRCEAACCNRVIISSEFFWAAPAMQSGLDYHEPTAKNFDFLNMFVEQCRDLFLSFFCSIKVVVYLRRQESWFDSFFNQQIKDGFSIPETDELAVTKNYLLYNRNIEMWAKYFGWENIIVKFYEQAKRDVIDDFCLTTGINMDKGVVKPTQSSETVNPRLSSTALGIMQRALQLQLEPKILDLLKDILRQTSLITADKEQGTSVFPESFYSDVSKCYRADNQKLAEKFSGAKNYLEPWGRKEQHVILSSEQSETPENKIEQLVNHLLLILSKHEGVSGRI